MSKAPISLFGSLQKLGQTRSGGQKFGLQIDISTELTLYPDDKEPFRPVAEAIRDTLKTNLKAGKQPNGDLMPKVAPATVERRAYRVAQAARGGKRGTRDTRFRTHSQRIDSLLDLADSAFGSNKAERATESSAKRKARDTMTLRRWRRRYPNGKYQPQGGNTFGNESGMLADSAAIRFISEDGKGAFEVYFANARGLLRSAGRTALQRVFKGGDDTPIFTHGGKSHAQPLSDKRVPLWDAKAMNQPAIGKALAEVPLILLGKRLGKLFNTIGETVDRAQALAEEAQEMGEDDGSY